MAIRSITHCRKVAASEKPLQIAGAINAYAALLAQRAGFRALYLSGAGVANHSCGIPDTGDVTLTDVLIDASRITRRVSLPLLVDIDTGWDDPAKAVRELAAVGAERMPAIVFVAGMGFAIALAVIGGSVPAWRGLRLQVAEALAGR